MSKITYQKLINQKKIKPITCLTAYTKSVAKILDGIVDIVLIGEDTNESGDIIEKINLSVAKNEPKVFRMKPISSEITKISEETYKSVWYSYWSSPVFS